MRISNISITGKRWKTSQKYYTPTLKRTSVIISSITTRGRDQNADGDFQNRWLQGCQPATMRARISALARTEMKNVNII